MIEPLKWYTLAELAELAKEGVVPFKARSTWIEFINNGKLPAIRKGNDNKFSYVIQGKDIIEFLDAIKVSANKA